MSLRYIWSKCTAKDVTVGWSTRETTNLYDKYLTVDGSTDIPRGTRLSVFICSELPTLTSDGYFEPQGSFTNYIVDAGEDFDDIMTKYFPTNTSYVQCKYLILMYPLYNNRFVCVAKFTNDNTHWKIQKSGPAYGPYKYNVHFRSTGNSFSVYDLIEAVPQTEKRKDQEIGYVSSVNGELHPSDGYEASSGYWYVMEGQDIIDPTAVTYSVSEPRGGENLTVEVLPRTNTFGGEIFYQYQCSTDGSRWENIDEPTADTEKTFVVPRGSEQIQVRVLASDEWGFESETYIYGAALKVQNINAFVGVNNARRIKKMFIGVNNIAREPTGGYVGVNGTARRWF